jgi:hypothetical protein
VEATRAMICSGVSCDALPVSCLLAAFVSVFTFQSFL